MGKQPAPITARYRQDEDGGEEGSLTFTLPYPPTLNSIWRATIVQTAGGPRVRILLSRTGRAYRRAVVRQVAGVGPLPGPAGARLAVRLVVHPPDRRKRDLSNVPKALEDALTHAGLWADDSLIDDLRVVRGPVNRGGHVVVTITPLEGQP